MEIHPRRLGVALLIGLVSLLRQTPLSTQVLLEPQKEKAPLVRWASTAREMVKLQQLSRHRNIAGVTLNQVNDRQAQEYSKYAYSHYYGN
jgi:hypothetical protein